MFSYELLDVFGDTFAFCLLKFHLVNFSKLSVKVLLSANVGVCFVHLVLMPELIMQPVEYIFLDVFVAVVVLEVCIIRHLLQMLHTISCFFIAPFLQ